MTAFVSSACASGHYEQYTYLESTGAVESSHTWILRHSGKQIETHWITPDTTYFNLCDETGDTREWRFQEAAADIRAWRSGNLIRVEGSRDGRKVSREVEIDAISWFQPLSYALGRFSQSQADSIIFWTIRPDNLDVVKLRTRKVGDEQVSTSAGTFLTRKISISLNGFLSRFWQAHYWFRQATDCLSATSAPTVCRAHRPPQYSWAAEGGVRLDCGIRAITNGHGNKAVTCPG